MVGQSSRRSPPTITVQRCSPSTTDSAWKKRYQNVINLFSRKEALVAEIQENEIRSVKALQDALASQYDLWNEKEVIDKAVDRMGRASENILSFAGTFDTFVQADPINAGLLWGSVKLIITVLARHKQLLESIVEMVDEMNREFPQIDDYTELFQGNDRVQDAAASLVYEYLSFYAQSALLLKKRRAKIMLRILWKSEERMFKESIKSIAKLKKHFETEVGLASRENNAVYQSRNETFMVKSLLHQEKMEQILLSKQSQVQIKALAKLPFSFIPYSRNSLFFGRKDLIEVVKSKLQSNVNSATTEQGSKPENNPVLSCALWGLGGIGKTQTAIEITYRMQSDFDIILWISASDDPHAISQAFSAICKKLELDPNNTQNTGTERQCVVDWLKETDKKWLIIFDNAYEASILKPYWPVATKGKGRILFTSRNSEWSMVADHSIKITSMSVEEGVDFLNYWLDQKDKDDLTSTLRGKRRTMEALIQELGGLPLFITHVAGYILQNKCSVANFYEIYKTQFGDVTSRSHLSIEVQYNLTWGNVWDLSFKSLSAESLHLISMFAFLAPDNIPESLFFEFQPTSGQRELVFNGRNHARFYNAIQDLSKHSLVDRGLIIDTPTSSSSSSPIASTNIYAIHREVKRKLLNEMGKDLDRRSECFENVLLLLAEAFPKRSDQGEAMNGLWPQCDQYSSSLLALFTAYIEAEPPFSPSVTDERLARLLFDGSWYLWEKRYFEQANTIAELAEGVIPEASKTSSLLYSDILTVIAAVNLESSRCHKGLAYARRTLKVVEAHIKTVENPGKKEMIYLANAINNVASGILAMDSSKLDEAASYLNRAGELKTTWASEETEPSLFTEHYCSMGRLRCLQGNFEEAISLSRKAVDLNRQVYEDTNMSRTTSFMDNLAFVLKAAGKHQEASEAYQQSLECRVNHLGERAQDTAISYHFLAVEYCEMGDLESARLSLNSAIEIFERSFMAEDRLARSSYLLFEVLTKISLSPDLTDTQRLETIQEAEKFKKSAIEHYNKTIETDQMPEEVQPGHRSYEGEQLDYKDFERLVYWGYR
ncbi:hypothetical protein TWF730_008538 [Orbilia blumenaviensis]|uniref:NB-ARC domain-containing protein n=1 Tax=Orbilia blumenaviensis TaxID=1796055 RepID=A0AAV9V6G8_9PEZI